MSRDTRKREWFVPADFMYGYTKEDDNHLWPERIGTRKRDAWCKFVLAILDLTGSHPVGTTSAVDISRLDGVQIEKALKDLRARGFAAEISGNEMIVTSHELRRSNRIFFEATKDIGY